MVNHLSLNGKLFCGVALVKQFLDLNRVRGIANYQFAGNIGHLLFPDSVKLVYSKKTGRIRYIYSDRNLIAVFRPTEGLFSLSIFGARKLVSCLAQPRFRVVIRDDVKQFIMEGRDVFSKHVIMADEEIRVGEEVVIVNGDDEVLGVGKALLSGKEMRVFKRGIAVKVRKGITEEKGCEE
jgi:predicted RNA-binding protein (TIGR00451 family)